MSGVRLTFRIFCLLVVLSAIALQCCEARGGRGGGFRGGGARFSRGSSRYSSSRSLSRSFRSSSLRRGTSPYTRSTWKTAAAIAMIYGSTRYLRSRRHRDHPDDMPTICTNRYDKSPNGTVWGYFICPKDGEADDMNYCCGEDEMEYCCRFGDDPGRVAGIVVGCLIGVGVIAFIVYMVYRHCIAKKGKRCSGAATPSVHYQVSHAPNAGPAPFSTTLSKQQPDSFGSGVPNVGFSPDPMAAGDYAAPPPPGKEALPPGDVSSTWGTTPYPPPYSAPQYSDPSVYPPVSDPSAYPPVSNPPAEGAPTGPPGAYPSQPPPPYGFTQ